MKLKELHIYRHPLPVRNAPYRMAGKQVYAVESVIVKLVADNGLVGWGETCPLGATYSEAHAAGAEAAIATVAADLIGTAITPRAINSAMDKLLHGHRYAKAAVDIATYDLLGKHYRKTVAELLGGALTNRVPSYYALGIGDPDETARIAGDKHKQGFNRLQIKAGGRDLSADVATAHKVHEQLKGTGVKLVVDANRGWCSRDTLLFSQQCRHIPLVIEQPCNTIEELANIQHSLQHPVYLDESTTDLATVITIVADGLASGFGMKLTRLGGLTPMATFRDLCESRNLPHTCDDSWGGDIIAASCVHIAATVQPHLLDGVWIAAAWIVQPSAQDR
ncbi:MAG: enolase C-terminal domain-like protein, partial [Pseudomonadota bacterium]